MAWSACSSRCVTISSVPLCNCDETLLTGSSVDLVLIWQLKNVGICGSRHGLRYLVHTVFVYEFNLCSHAISWRPIPPTIPITIRHAPGYIGFSAPISDPDVIVGHSDVLYHMLCEGDHVLPTDKSPFSSPGFMDLLNRVWRSKSNRLMNI